MTTLEKCSRLLQKAHRRRFSLSYISSVSQMWPGRSGRVGCWLRKKTTATVDYTLWFTIMQITHLQLDLLRGRQQLRLLQSAPRPTEAPCANMSSQGETSRSTLCITSCSSGIVVVAAAALWRSRYINSSRCFFTIIKQMNEKIKGSPCRPRRFAALRLFLCFEHWAEVTPNSVKMVLTLFYNKMYKENQPLFNCTSLHIDCIS